MKRIVLLFTVIILSNLAVSQSNSLGLRVALSYGHEMLIGGYVKVREFELEGTKVEFKDFKSTNYPSFDFSLEKSFKNNQGIGVQYKRFYIRGNATFDKNIEYNGTIIDGRQGIDLSPTSYYRLKAFYYGNLKNEESMKINYLVGFVYDFMNFYLDGEISKSSERYEVFEGFYRQAFPYPFIGGQYSVNITDKEELNFVLIGSYVPRFKSFFEEGGKVSLEYKTLESEVGYFKQIKNFELGASINFRYFELMQESVEDENFIRTYTISPIIRFAYHL